MPFKDIPFRGNFNFLGLPEGDTGYKNAKAVILPVPYDGTTSFRPGTRDGPLAILSASRNVELFDAEFRCEPLNRGIHTLQELEPDMRGPEFMVNRTERAIEAMVKDGKFPVMLGGEHSLSSGPAKVLQKKHGRDFCVLQLDAHGDLRDEFENTPYSHASVMRRIIEFSPITQVGIRNISKGEMDFIRKAQHKKIFWARDIQCPSELWVPKVLKTLKKKVYISIDLDVFDPSIMPAVGTPEPGGLGWYPVINLLEKVIRERDVVGIDIVELCPIPGFIAPDFLVAKLLFKLLSEVFSKKGWGPKSEEAGS